MVVPEKADTRARAGQEIVEACRLADVPKALTVPLKANSGRSVVCQHDIQRSERDQRVDLVASVVAARIPLQRARSATVVRRPVTTTDTADAERLRTIREVEALAIAEMKEARKQLDALLRAEPAEIFVIALDEQRTSRRCSLLCDPSWEVTRAVMTASRAIDHRRIGPDTKVADVENPVEAQRERGLEGGYVGVHSVERTVNVAGSTDDHAFFCLLLGRPGKAVFASKLACLF